MTIEELKRQLYKVGEVYNGVFSIHYKKSYAFIFYPNHILKMFCVYLRFPGGKTAALIEDAEASNYKSFDEIISELEVLAETCPICNKTVGVENIRHYGISDRCCDKCRKIIKRI